MTKEEEEELANDCIEQGKGSCVQSGVTLEGSMGKGRLDTSHL